MVSENGTEAASLIAQHGDDARLLAWFRDGHAALAQTLATADPAVACATFMPAPSPLAFWARRQAHETAIHRADADSAAGTMPEYEADFAADGIDELIMGFGRRRKYQPGADGGTGLRVLATDTSDAWLIEALEGRVLPRRDAGSQEEAGCTVSGPASGLTSSIAIQEAMAGSRSTAARVTRGAISLSSSRHFPLRPYSNIVNPVALLPA